MPEGDEIQNRAEASGALGLILRRMGKWEEALVYLEDAAKTDPLNYVLVLDGLGVTNLYLRRYKEADTYISRAMSLEPGIPTAYMHKSWPQLCRDGDVEAADRVLWQAIDRIAPEGLL